MIILVPDNLREKVEAWMGIVLRAPCGCALCHEVNEFYAARRAADEEAKAQFNALVTVPADPPRYVGMIELHRIGKRWPGITIDQPRSEYWIRDCNDGG